MKGYLLIIVTLIVVISALITMNIFFQQSLQTEMAEQFSEQQSLLSKTIARDITTYLSLIKQDVLHMAGMLSKLELTHEIYDELQKGAVITIIKVDIGVLDSKGDVLFFKGNRRLLKYAVSDILRQSRKMPAGSAKIIEDPPIVYAIAPIQRQGAFKGVVLLSVSISDIANHFVSSIKSGSKGYAWIMDGDGTLLYHPTQPSMVGGNIYKADAACFKCHRTFDLEKKIVEGKASSYGRYISPIGEDKIIAFSTAAIDNILWITSASAPYSEVTRAIRQSTKLYSYLIISIFITTSLISALLIVFNKRRIKAEEMAKRKEELEKYAVELEEKVNERTAELSSEKEKLNTIVSAIGVAIVLIDKKGRIQWANQTMSSMAGADLIGMHCEDIYPDCSISEACSISDIETMILSNLFGQKDKYFQITTAPVRGEGGRIHGYIKLIQDVTEMKKMEEQIMHSEKLAAIGRLAAGIAHEIGNPLTSIFSFVQILREMEKDDFKKESLETIYFHINRISEILKQLSGFSKMPAGDASQCHINEIIEASINLIQYDKKAKNISIVKELSPSLPEMVCSGNQLSQVFVNLTLNAIDAMPEGGSLTIKSMMRGRKIIVQFKDTGIGIPKEDMARIFDPFYTTKEKGTGLGLAVSYDIIKKMDGTLSIESEVGQGSIFTITLPV